MMEAVDKMRGKAGSKILLTLVREGGQPFDVELIRAVIKVKSVKSQLLDDGYGLIRISQFQINTGDEVAKALAKLRKRTTARSCAASSSTCATTPAACCRQRWKSPITSSRKA